MTVSNDVLKLSIGCNIINSKTISCRDDYNIHVLLLLTLRSLFFGLILSAL